MKPCSTPRATPAQLADCEEHCRAYAKWLAEQFAKTPLPVSLIYQISWELTRAIADGVARIVSDRQRADELAIDTILHAMRKGN